LKEKRTMEKAIVIDYADPSVGLMQRDYSVDLPFDLFDGDTDTREFFRTKIAELYGEFAEGKIVVHFQDEIEAMEKKYAEGLQLIDEFVAAFDSPAPDTGAQTTEG